MSTPTSLSTLLPHFLTGTIFGASLLLSGVSSPQTLTQQFALQDFHMLLTFLTASAISAVVVYASNRTRFATLPARSCSDYGWTGLGRYGGNVVGGAMQGIGMAVSGACPGTSLVQRALGWGRGNWILGGGVLGGALFILFGEKLRAERRGRKARVTAPEVKTLHEKAGVSVEVMVLIYEVVMGGVVVAASLFAPISTPWRRAVMGGVLIGIAQAMSVLFSRKTLGVSTAYQDVAGHVIGLLDRKRARPGWSSIVFAAGVMAGAKIVGAYFDVESPDPNAVHIGIIPAVVGGAMFTFGARLAGGCTSGHGISGCATLSVSSVVTVAAMFGGGIAFKMLF